ncbi:fms-related tyrosine kinase 3 ligand [Sphaerodactylus townsendi]|uniref:fms-related tyrosine kinase 3 ligand n=1 Tax=Sphaerodactylus townsendi TaxID=933632 RepID=UPI002025DA65|nr:fms-related tyrosine kinase 3 ligand [Sphaerodactylus townsendi]
MIRYHGIPDASVVSLLLLLCFTHSGFGENCIFTEELLPTTSISSTIKKLKGLLLLDYPVSLPSNLKSDELCFELWQLHFISRELNRMLQVAGSELRKNISELETRMNLEDLFEDCKIESDCVDFERSNISVFFDSIPKIFRAVRDKMEDLPKDFSSCTPIRCQPDSLSTPYVSYSSQMLNTIEASKAANHQRHHWLLIPISLLVYLFISVKCSSRSTFQPQPLQV